MRIVDLTQYVSGPFATMLLAELGAEVIKVEPPSGDPWRECQGRPFETSFDFLNRRKRSVSVDIRRREGRSLLLKLVATADAVVENFSDDARRKARLSLRALHKANRNVILTSITTLGLDGPCSNLPASELTLQAIGGGLIGTGWSDGPPLKLPGYAASFVAGINGAISTLASVYGVSTGVEPAVHNEVAMQETLLPHWMSPLSLYAYTGAETGRDDRGPNRRQGLAHTMKAKDGYVYIMFSIDDEWMPFADFLGLDERFRSGDWCDPEARYLRWAELEPELARALARRNRHEWFTAAAEKGYMFGPVDEPEDVVTSPQLAARGFFQTAWLSDGREVPCPSLPFTVASGPLAPNRAPALGEHNLEVLGELGLSSAEVQRLQEARIII